MRAHIYVILHSSERSSFHNTVVTVFPLNIPTMTVTISMIFIFTPTVLSPDPFPTTTPYICLYDHSTPSPNSARVNFVHVCQKDLLSICQPRPLFSPDKQGTWHLPEPSHDYPLFPVCHNDLSSACQSHPRSYHDKIYAPFRGLVIYQPTVWSFSFCVNFISVYHKDLSYVCQPRPLLDTYSIPRTFHLPVHRILVLYLRYFYTCLPQRSIICLPATPSFYPDKQGTCHLPESLHDRSLFPVRHYDLSSTCQPRPRSYHDKIHAPFWGLIIYQPTACSFSVCIETPRFLHALS